MELGVLMSPPAQFTQSPALTRLSVPATLCVNSLTVPLEALIDSGAKDSFLDKEPAIQSGISLEPLEETLTAYPLDGSKITSDRENQLSQTSHLC